MLCIECGSDAVMFVGAGSKFIAIDHYQCRSCDCDFMIKREKETWLASAGSRKTDDRAVIHPIKPSLPSGSTN